MLKNYFRIAFRNLTRNRFSSAINIGGLAIGMAVAILIGLWIYDEMSFDHDIPNNGRIANVMHNQTYNGNIQTWWSMPMQAEPVLRKDYGNLFKHIVLDGGTGTRLLTYGDKKIKPTGDFIQPEIIDMLSMKMLRGNSKALTDPSSLVLSASLARELFGDEDPMGKVVQMDNKIPLKVTGVYADFAQNNSWNSVRYMAPWQLLVTTEDFAHRVNWGNSWFQIYVELNDNTDITAASKAIKNLIPNATGKEDNTRPELWLFPMDKWHLYSDFRNGVSDGGRIRFVRLYAIIGAFVLLLACINFMNLSTARSEKRAREVGIRKTMGSMRGQLIRQFFSESMVIAFAALLLAIVIAQLLLPFFDDVADKKITIPYSQPGFWLAGLGFAFFTGLLAGSYPALYLSAFSPVKVLKGSFRVGRTAATPRKVLVVVQFSVSVILIVGTIAILHQIQYAKDRPVGYTREGLVTVPLQNLKPGDHWEALRRDLQATGMVADIAGSESSAANTYVNNSGFSWRGKDPTVEDQFITNGITPEFGKVAGWKVLEGRDFVHTQYTDSNHIIINEAAARYMGLKHPVGETVRWGDNGLYTIVGVVRDMISQSPYEKVHPMIFYVSAYMSWSRLYVVDVRLQPQAAMSQALAAIAKVFRQYDPGDPFEYSFADQEYARKFEDAERTSRLAAFFAVLAILISCLGLLGLSAFVAEQRTREIGIRKVLGASVLSLWGLLSREFVVLVCISLLVGGPVSGWLMSQWLSQYELHANLSWWIFGVTALGSIGITLLTVSFQAVRAALSNPVQSLRSE